MKTEAQRKQDYELGYKQAVIDAKRFIDYGDGIAKMIGILMFAAGMKNDRAFFTKDGRFVLIKTVWVKGYDQALLDIKDGKIKSEVEE